MSMARPADFERRTCPKCGTVQESPGSTVCEQCGTDLARPAVASSPPARVATPLKERLGAPARAVLAVPVRLFRRGVAFLEWLIALIVQIVSFTLRAVVVLAVLAAIVIGLSFVPEVQARVPVVKKVAATAQQWFQRAEDAGRKRLASWQSGAQPTQSARPAASPQKASSQKATSPKPAAQKPTTQKPASQKVASPKPAPARSAKPTLTVKSTPGGATVLLSGKRVGRTPLTLKVAPGTYKLTVSRPGYKSFIRTITVKAGTAPALNVTLTLAP